MLKVSCDECQLTYKCYKLSKNRRFVCCCFAEVEKTNHINCCNVCINVYISRKNYYFESPVITYCQMCQYRVTIHFLGRLCNSLEEAHMYT